MALLRKLKAVCLVECVVRGKFSFHVVRSSKRLASDYFLGSQVHSRAISSCFYNGCAEHNLMSDHSEMRIRYSSKMLMTNSSEFVGSKRSLTTQAQTRQKGTLGIVMSSPGFIYEPYAPREPISFWQRWFTRRGWRRMKDDVIQEFRSVYAIQKLRKSGYSKNKFYQEASVLYKEINKLMADGEKTILRKLLTENMYSQIKNEMRQRKSKWSSVYWEAIEPFKIRTLRARAIGVDRNDLDKIFVQMTLEFLSKQKFEAYDEEGKVVAGDRSKEVLVRDIWVFEKSLFHPQSYWRLCGRIVL